MRINHNITALNTYRQFNNANNAQSKSMEKLSSGLRINSAADDAAGLAISEKMRGQIRGLDTASRNAQDGVSMVQTAEGALTETHDILQRMRELSVQASNDTNTADDRNEIQKEIGQLNSEVDRIAGSTEFNTQKLLNGSLGASATSSDATHVAVVSSTGLKAGNYAVTVNTAATKATTVPSTAAYVDDTAVNTAFGATDKDIAINGVQIDTAGVSNKGGLLTAINSKSAETGFTAAYDGSNKLVFTATEFGSGKTLNITGADASTINGGALTDGKDAVATIAGPDDTKVVTGTGQKLVYGTAEFTATATTNGQAATVTVASSGVSLQIGANKDQNMIIDINQMDTTTLGNPTDKIKDVNVLTTAGANKAIKTVDDAIKQVSSERSKLGAFQNRLDHTINNLSTSSENLTSAESRIRDVDYALAA